MNESHVLVLAALAEGLTTKEIADRLHYSERTIKNRIADICISLGATTRAHAVAIALRRGLIG